MLGIRSVAYATTVPSAPRVTARLAGARPGRRVGAHGEGQQEEPRKGKGGRRQGAGQAVPAERTPGGEPPPLRGRRLEGADGRVREGGEGQGGRRVREHRRRDQEEEGRDGEEPERQERGAPAEHAIREAPGQEHGE